MKYNPRDENSIKAVMAKANVVINLIGVCSMIINQLSMILWILSWKYPKKIIFVIAVSHIKYMIIRKGLRDKELQL